MKTVFVIDAKAERRAEVCRVLLQGERHAEPFETAADFLAFAREESLALVHDADGAAAGLCDRLRDAPQLVPVVGYSESPSFSRAVTAMQAGAASYLAWPFTVDEFSEEIDRIEPAMRETLDRKRRVAEARRLLAGLTAREREVLVNLISHGTNKAIAKELEISPRTVEKYRAAILVRLGVANTAQAIRVAVEAGAVEGDFTDSARKGAAASPAQAGLMG